MNTLDLVNAIRAGDSRKTQEVFETLTAERIENRIGELRTSIAQNMFTPVVEESVELTEEQFNALDEESKELYELSKSTLGSYVKKAHMQGGLSSFRHGVAVGNAGAYSKRPDKKTAKENAVISNKRTDGIHKAVDRLSK